MKSQNHRIFTPGAFILHGVSMSTDLQKREVLSRCRSGVGASTFLHPPWRRRELLEVSP